MRKTKRRFLVCGGIDGDDAAFGRLTRLINDHQPDAVLFVGGINPSSENTPDDLTPREVDLWNRFFETIGKSGVYTAFISGPYETPKEDFLQAAMNAEVDYENVHCVHGTLTEDTDLALCGIGGELVDTSSVSGERWQTPRPVAEYFLRRLWASEMPRKFLLLACPPTGKLGGDHGHKIVNEFIDSYHPDLCAVLGESANRGFERVSHTYVINPGRLSDGYAALFDWSKPVEERVELLEMSAAAQT